MVQKKNISKCEKIGNYQHSNKIDILDNSHGNVNIVMV